MSTYLEALNTELGHARWLGNKARIAAIEAEIRANGGTVHGAPAPIETATVDIDDVETAAAPRRKTR